MRSVTSFNDGWLFEGQPVSLPHTAVELPFSYFDEKSYQREFTYTKTFTADPGWAGKEVAIVFDGAMANARVALNGKPVAAHKDGYTPFEARLTGLVKDGDNTLTVTIDGSESPEIPPFGATIDYLTYAGIYRDTWLRITAPVSIGNVKIETPDVLAVAKTVTVHILLANPGALALSGRVTVTLRDAAGKAIATGDATVEGGSVAITLGDLDGIALWDVSDPRLYTIETSLETPHGTDALATTFGFREARFTPSGFRLNGRLLKLRGLNRHQSFPYVGYAMGRAAQERDAEILKRELHANIVRTSHYPQSKWFLDACDRLGLLVFEEIPGWQHIGGAAWKAEAVENVRRMISRELGPWTARLCIWSVEDRTIAFSPSLSACSRSQTPP